MYGIEKLKQLCNEWDDNLVGHNQKFNENM